MAVETELRFRIPESALERVRALPRLAGGTPVELEAAYYDTPECALSRAGVALRVRREGTRWVQALKWSRGAHGGTLQRNELELELSGAVPDLSGVAHPDLDALLHQADFASALREVFRTRIARTVSLITAPDGSIVEAALDCGEIAAGGRTERVCELELELKAGKTGALFDLARELADSAPLSLDSRSKAERGFALAQGTPDAPRKAAAPALTSGMSVSDALAAIAWSTLAQLQANEPGVLKGRDPEFLHQMRVGLRRLRSALSVFRKVIPEATLEPLVAELRWLGTALGPARDWDVFLGETLPPLASRFEGHAGLSALAADARNRQKAAYRGVKAALRSRRYQRLLLDLSGWIATQAWRADAAGRSAAQWDAPARAYAERELETRYRRVRKRGRKGAQLAFDDLHRLRIAIKKLRYAVDFFGGLFDDEAARGLRSRLSRLQDVLGTINDAATLRALIDDGLAPGRSAAAAEARGILLGWSAGRADALRENAERALKAFRRTAPFW